MVITHIDGFTEDLISFTCEVDRETVSVIGKWFCVGKNDKNCRIEYLDSVDAGLIDDIKRDLVELNDSYEMMVTDLSTEIVEWNDGNRIISRKFYGVGELLYEEYPVLKGRLDNLMKFINQHYERVASASN